MGIISGIIMLPISIAKWCIGATILFGASVINPFFGLGMAAGRGIKRQHKKDVEKAVEKALKKKGKN